MQLFDARVRSPVKGWQNIQKPKPGQLSGLRDEVLKWAHMNPEIHHTLVTDMLLYDYDMSVFKQQTSATLGTVWDKDGALRWCSTEEAKINNPVFRSSASGEGYIISMPGRSIGQNKPEDIFSEWCPSLGCNDQSRTRGSTLRAWCVFPTKTAWHGRQKMAIILGSRGGGSQASTCFVRVTIVGFGAQSTCVSVKVCRSVQRWIKMEVKLDMTYWWLAGSPTSARRVEPMGN